MVGATGSRSVEMTRRLYYVTIFLLVTMRMRAYSVIWSRVDSWLIVARHQPDLTQSTMPLSYLLLGQNSGVKLDEPVSIHHATRSGFDRLRACRALRGCRHDMGGPRIPHIAVVAAGSHISDP